MCDTMGCCNPGLDVIGWCVVLLREVLEEDELDGLPSRSPKLCDGCCAECEFLDFSPEVRAEMRRFARACVVMNLMPDILSIVERAVEKPDLAKMTATEALEWAQAYKDGRVE